MDVVAKIVLKAEYRQYFDAGLKELLPNTLAEPGCERFEVYLDDEAPNTFWLVERWRSKEDLDEHYAQPYVRAMFENYDTWLAAPLEVMKLSSFNAS